MSGNVHHLYPTPACGVRRVVPSLPLVLVDTLCIWHIAPSMGLVPGCVDEKGHAGVSR